MGSFAANAWGVYDMHGNVWEWVQDYWNSSYEGAPADGSVREFLLFGYRVQRGGSWASLPGDLRSANRDSFTAVLWRGRYGGFRIVRSF